MDGFLKGVGRFEPVATHRILVVDDSPAMRETLCVLLGGTYEVRAVAVEDLGAVRLGPCDLTIAAEHLQNSSLLPPAARLWLGGDPGGGGLSRRFTPSELRRQVTEVLCAAPADRTVGGGDWRLRPPFLDDGARAVVERACETGLALHIAGEPGSGKHAVARAIHHRSGGAFHVCDADKPVPSPEEVRSRPATVLAIGVERWPAESQRALAETLASAVARNLRVISTATDDLAEMVDRRQFLPDLYYRLTLLGIRLRPLRERPTEVPAIATTLSDEISERLGRPRPTFTDAAMRRLSHYLWFGNLAELEAVLTRTLALAAQPVIDAGDLLFDGSAIVGVAPTGSPPRPVASGRAPQAASGNLNLLIHELAHEFKNPLVTIKTFTRHCQKALLQGESDEMRFAEMTDRAVDQMDRTLENLLVFTRMPRPRPQDVALDSVLGPLLANGSDLHVDYAPGAQVTVRVDPEQTSYALDNLLRALGRGLPDDQPIRLRFASPDSVLCQVPPGFASTNDTLNDLVGDGEAAMEMPLGVAIASAVLERNGAELRMERDGETTTAMIRFPVVVNEDEGEAKRNGTSQSIDR